MPRKPRTISASAMEEFYVRLDRSLENVVETVILCEEMAGKMHLPEVHLRLNTAVQQLGWARSHLATAKKTLQESQAAQPSDVLEFKTSPKKAAAHARRQKP